MKEGDQVTLWIEEAPQTQVAIGSLTSDEEHREQLAREIQLRLPHAAFTDFWNAASSTDSATRNVTLKMEDAMMELAITDVVLLEGTPIHPVVAELRFMWRPLRLFLIGLFAAAGVLVALEIVRVIWVLWHGGSAGGRSPQSARTYCCTSLETIALMPPAAALRRKTAFGEKTVFNGAGPAKRPTACRRYAPHSSFFWHHRCCRRALVGEHDRAAIPR